ncbi:MAG TPA: radical SAM family heme chaperone HemW [Solirubrobacteraceae bacterium]|nr:radical SAM family heme chaperone HemW [Solirubrobacteraceae bacterium]
MEAAQTPLGIYIHVPFCAARCGYCDFNTYVPSSAAQPSEYLAAALREIAYARGELGDRQVSTVFIGGGTPTLIGTDLLRLLDGVRDAFGLVVGAEVTTEANPESTDPELLRALHAGGFTRISLGMQSAAPHVLRTLDRVHTPGRAAAAAAEAREAGFEHVSLDLIYGTPGETDADWARTLDAALASEPDHISAYALTLEPGTAMSGAVQSGRLPAPDDADQARRYAYADELLSARGFDWYELSSWATSAAARCRHNIGYWRSYDWWGIGPGAHSHVGGVRWWNLPRPAAYSQATAAGRSPAAGREVLTGAERALENVMLGLRERGGLALSSLTAAGALAAELEVSRRRVVIIEGSVQLTRRGRLFADAVIRELSV